MTTEPPTADIVRVTQNLVTVICPYCSRQHRHKFFGPGKQRFAPGCGMYRNSKQRATGYTFNLPPPNGEGITQQGAKTHERN